MKKTQERILLFEPWYEEKEIPDEEQYFIFTHEPESDGTVPYIMFEINDRVVTVSHGVL